MTLEAIKQTKDGEDIEFNNSEWCERNESDAIIGGSLMWSTASEKFLLFFNGKCMLATTSPACALKALVKIMDKGNCEITN